MPVLAVLIALVFIVSLFLAVQSVRSEEAVSPAMFTNVTLMIRVPKETGREEQAVAQKAPLLAEQMFASLHGLLRLTPAVQEHLSFEIAADPAGICFYAVVPTHLRSFVESQIYAQYPNAEVREVPDYAAASAAAPGAKAVACSLVTLAKEYYYPLQTFRDFEVDPLAAITSAFSILGEQEEVWLQLLLRPMADGWQAAGHAHVEAVRSGAKAPPGLLDAVAGMLKEEFLALPGRLFEAILFPPKEERYVPPKREVVVRLSAGQAAALEAIEVKLSKMGFEVLIRAVAMADQMETAEARLRGLIASLKQFSTADLNGLVSSGPVGDKARFLEEYRRRVFLPDQAYVFSTEELASVYHLPSAFVETPAIAWSPAKRGEPPLNLPTEDCTYFGETTFRESLVKFGIRDGDRRQHLYILGKTGVGKTKIFENMAIQDMRNGKGVVVIDPHGSLVDILLDYIPDDRVEDVVLFRPSDSDRPVALNPLECSSTESTQRNLVASGIVGALKQQFWSWGPRLEHLLNNAVLTLVAVPNTTFLGIVRLLNDKNYQKYMLTKVDDPVIREFWLKEYKDMMSNPRLITEAVAPIQNKVGRFLASTTIRNILGQPRSTIKLDEIMDEGKILLVDLAKGRIGEDNSNLLGSLIISRLQFMAMQRVDIPEEERRDVFLYVDEFQNFASAKAFESILAEARKMRLCLHLTHQYVAQLPEELRDAVFGNVGTLITLTLSANDANELAYEFAPVFTAQDLISLERQHMYLKLLINGQTSPPFSAQSLYAISMSEEPTGNRDKVIALSREKYGTSAEEVASRIKRWSERQFDLGLAKAEAARAGEPIPEDLPERLGFKESAPPRYYKGGGGGGGGRRPKALRGEIKLRPKEIISSK